MRHEAHRRRPMGTNEVETNDCGLFKFLFSISEACLKPSNGIPPTISLRSDEAESLKTEALTRG